MSSFEVTVCIPSIPPRSQLLGRALVSVCAQTRPPAAISVAIDHDHAGAAATRNRALQAVQTAWVAFLDDDDEFGPRHLQRLTEEAAATGADLVYPWYEVAGGTDPFPQHEGRPWDITPANLDQIRQFPITVLCRTGLLRAVGGFTRPVDPEVRVDGNRVGEDLLCWIELVKAGAKIVHLPERTWTWHHWSGNTSGRSERW